MCLICNETINVNTEYNIKQHYDSKHADGVYGKLKGRDRELKVKQLKEQLKILRFMIQKMHTGNEKTLRCSFLIVQRVAQTMKPYSKVDFVKNCLTDVTEEMYPKMVQEFEKISLSRWTIARRIDKLACDICDTLNPYPPESKFFVHFSIVALERCNLKGKSALFARNLLLCEI